MKLKNIILGLGLSLLMNTTFAQGGLEGIVVERYYQTDASDGANASTNGAINALTTGTVVYRVYVDMAAGYKFSQLYGTSTHDFKLNTTTNFYNDPNYGVATEPNTISLTNAKKHTALIDSWFTLGGVCVGKSGVLKTEDTDGSIGNTQSILDNNPGACYGSPINGANSQDGLVASTTLTAASTSANTFQMLGITSSQLALLDQGSGNSFLSNGGSISALGGIKGTNASNMVLVGQFTTSGVLSFELNVQLIAANGTSENWVARNRTGNEYTSASLIFNSSAPTASNQSFCSGNSPTVADLVASGSGIKWYTDPTGGTALSAGTALISDTYYASQTFSGCEGTNRTAVVVTVNTTPQAPTTEAQSFCTATVGALTATTGTAIKWYTAATGGSALASTSALVSGNYYATQTVAGCESTTRALTAITINAPAAPTTTSAQSFCSASAPTVANLAATGTAIKWYSASTGGSALSTTTALGSGNYYASQTVGGCESATRTVAAVTVKISPAAPTTTATQSFCSAVSPTVAGLAATGTAVKWYSASTGGTALATNTALATGNYYVSQTVTGCESATRALAAVTVNTNPSVPTTESQSFCSEVSPTVAGLIAAGTAIKWYSASTGGSALSATTALASGNYYASQTVAGCESTTRALTAITVNTNPSAPTTTAQTFCSGTAPTVADLATTAGEGIQWYDASTSGSALSTTTALATGNYYASQSVAGCESTTRALTAITVNTTPSAPTATAQDFCAASLPTVANLAATGTAVQWFSASTGGTALSSSTALATGNYFASQTVTGCESTTRTSVAVTLSTPIAGTITASANSICTGTSSLLTLTGNDGTIQWQVSTTSSTTGFTDISGASSNTYNTPVLLANRWYRAKVSKSSCAAVYSVARSITVTTVPSVGGTLSSDVTICRSSGTTLTLAGSSGTIVWQYSTTWTSATPTWLTAVGTTTSLATGALTASRAYRAKLTSGSCISYSNQVVVTVSPTSAVAVITGYGTFCTGSNVNLAIASATGTIQWQESPTSTGTFTDIVGANGLNYTITNLQSTKSYRVVVTSGVCSSITSLVKTVICSPLAIGGTITSNKGASVCPGTSTTFTSAGSVGTKQWQSSTNGVDFTDIAASVAATKVIVISSPIWVRVKLTSGTCAVQYSNVIFTDVLPAANGGTISGLNSVVVNTGTTLTVTGSTGTIAWQKSTDNVTWTAITGTSTSLATGNLAVSTYYRVKATVGTCYVYSPVFLVTVTAQRTTDIESTSFEAIAYPNPFADNFMLEVSASTNEMIQVNVYDMLGKLVENHNVKVSDLSTFVIGNKFVSGVYNIEVIQGTQIERLRVVKN
jgi:hypothetical protein